jgi:Mce-associated membrane protein
MTLIDTIRSRGLMLLTGVLVLAAVVIFALAHQQNNTDHVGNHAVVDIAATTEVQTEISQTLVRVFSYDYGDPAPTHRAADELLTGQAREDYAVLFQSLEERAPGQRLLLTAQVQVAAVQDLRDDTASLLVFLDQASQRASDQESTISAAQLSVEAERIDGIWKVADFEPL